MTPLHLAAVSNNIQATDLILGRLSKLKLSNQIEIVSELNPHTDFSPLSLAIN